MTGINSNVPHHDLPQVESLQLKKGLEAKVDIKNGMINLSNGDSYKVSFVPDGKTLPVNMSLQQQLQLAKSALAILEKSGHDFSSSNKIEIQKDKITHHSVEGKKEILKSEQDLKGLDSPKESWVDTAEKVITYFNAFSKESDPQENQLGKREGKDGPVIKLKKETGPILQLQRVTSELIPLNEQLSPDPKITLVRLPRGESSNPPPVPKRLPLQSKISQLITSRNSPPKLLADHVVGLLGKEISEKIEQFTDQHRNKIEYLKDNGWVTAKKDKKEEMANSKSDPDNKEVSFADFRDQVNKLVHEIVNDAATTMGIPKTTIQIFGTPGYNSDKDISLTSANPEQPLTTGEMVLLKSVADLVTAKIMGVLPGTALDTEWYVELKFMGKEVEGEKGKAQLATLDMAMGIMQAKEGLKNDPEQWKNFKGRDLEQTSSPTKEIKMRLYDQVEGFYQSLEVEVEKELIFQDRCDEGMTPKLAREFVNALSQDRIASTVKDIKIKYQDGFDKKYYDAKVLAQYPKLMELGEKCASLENKIADMKKINPKDPQIDGLIVEHDILYALINSRQPEGTMSSSELKTTLLSELGQKAARSRENGIKELQKGLGKEKVGPSNTEPFVIRSRQQRTKMQVKNLAPLKEGANLLAEIDDKIDRGAGYTAPQLILAGQERLGQFMHVVLHNHNPVDAGKYCLRVAEANLFSLEKVKGQLLEEKKTAETELEKLGPNVRRGIDRTKLNELDKKLVDLESDLQQLEVLLQKASIKYPEAKQLEQCKRKFNLNTLATEEMVFKQLSGNVPKEKQATLKTDLKEMLSKQDFGYLDNDTMIKEEKIGTMCQDLVNKGYIKKTDTEMVEVAPGIAFMFPKDPALRQIFEARVGYNQDYYAETLGMAKLKDLLDQVKPSNTLDKAKIPSLIDGFKKVIGKINKDHRYDAHLKGLERGKSNPPEDIQRLLRELGEELEVKINRVAKEQMSVVNRLQNKGVDMVLNRHGFVGERKNSKVEEFALDVESFTREVQNFMFDKGHMPKLSGEVNILTAWK